MKVFRFKWSPQSQSPEYDGCEGFFSIEADDFKEAVGIFIRLQGDFDQTWRQAEGEYQVETPQPCVWTRERVKQWDLEQYPW